MQRRGGGAMTNRGYWGTMWLDSTRNMTVVRGDQTALVDTLLDRTVSGDSALIVMISHSDAVGGAPAVYDQVWVAQSMVGRLAWEPPSISRDALVQYSHQRDSTLNEVIRQTPRINAFVAAGR